MKIGLLTAAFPDTPLTEVADWAAATASRCSRSPAGREPTARPGATPGGAHRLRRPLRRAGQGDRR